MAESAVITAVKAKISKLIAQSDRLREENRKVASERDRLKTANRDLQEKVAEMERRISILELRDSMGAGSGDSKKARARVNRLMREVDKCIALLNR